MDAVVVVPWRKGCPYRAQARDWCYRQHVDAGFEVRESAHTDGPWVKASAVMPTIEAVDAEVVILADADVWCEGLPEAIEAVRSGAVWAVPHLNVYRMSEKGTAAVLRGGEWRKQSLDERPYPGVLGGGYVVARRETFLECPLDPRFVGWGQDDEAHGLALATLYGPPWRGDADLVHLWHPAQPRLSRGRGSKESWTLRRRYIDAMRQHERTGSTDEMRSLLNEAKIAALDAPEHSLHD